MSYFEETGGKKFADLDKDQLKKHLEEAANLTGRELYFIDVRQPSEIEETGVVKHAGIAAINIPMAAIEEALTMESDDFQSKYGRKKPDEKVDILIFSCAAGGRSATASALAVSKGYLNVAHYTGGAWGWFK